jgi:hypothetical protein
VAIPGDQLPQFIETAVRETRLSTLTKPSARQSLLDDLPGPSLPSIPWVSSDEIKVDHMLPQAVRRALLIRVQRLARND